jgi:F-type H+-transporting ATPase subunit gamma
VRAVCLLVVTADKGLCGSFNTNAIRAVENHMASRPDVNFKLVCVGRKGYQYFSRRGYDVAGHWTFIDQDLPTALLQKINDLLSGLFLEREVDEVTAVFNRFHSIVVQRPVVTQFLPVSPPEEQAEGSAREIDFIFEPDPVRIYQELIPSYSRVMLFDYLADSIASEHGARMNAMRNATDAAQDMIKNLTLRFNKARQASITSELMDIVGGAEALVEG